MFNASGQVSPAFVENNSEAYRTLQDLEKGSVSPDSSRSINQNKGYSSSAFTQQDKIATGTKTHKKGGLLKGALIGGGIGLLPLAIGSIFGESTGQGGAYISIVTFPVGIIAGAIIGATSKKKHHAIETH